ncbi:MAG: right-handed parallel beta-helix repeat-containing protein, partial [Deltaproteobacteria bacterium]|nr:right-handed parallel beta-helix repeat-containing protein [Deltaproteobacteria bacterium]
MFIRIFTIFIILISLACGGLTQSELISNHEGEDGDTVEAVEVVQANGGNDELILQWSNASTWGGRVPQAGDTVLIPQGARVVLDQDTPDLAGLTIEGTLEFAPQDIQLTADWILVMGGQLIIGSEETPYEHQATITLDATDTTEEVMGHMGTRGIMVMNGTLSLHGASPAVTWTQINDHAYEGSSQLTLKESVDWQVGDQLVLAPTDFFGVSFTEKLELSSTNENKLSLSSPLSGFHWGRLQYVTSEGLSLSPDDSVTAPGSSSEIETPLVLDERAEIGNLTRNIVIQGPDDELWQEKGFGAHVMVMGLSSIVEVDGVEFRRVGQAGFLARYPFHWHRLSYDGEGAERGDATGQYLRNSSIHQSSNRCVTIHGTNGVLVENNICYDILGHAIFFEDAVERRNTVENNLVLRVRFPTASNALKLHDRAQSGTESGSSGIWVSNPDNTVRYNHIADSQGFGIWMAFPENPVGGNTEVPIRPNRLLFGNFDSNTAHSNDLRGIMFDNAEIDNEGTVAALQYASTTDGQEINYPYDSLRRFSMNHMTVYKNGHGNFWNRVVWPDYAGWVSADGEGKYFSGSGSRGVIQHSLLIGESLNNFSDRPHPWTGPPVAFATYHSAYSMRENILVNFAYEDGVTSGAFATDDYYLEPVDKGHIRNSDNLLIHSHPGHRSRASINENI